MTVPLYNETNAKPASAGQSPEDSAIRKRRNEVLRGVIVVLAAGTVYAAFVLLTGIALPCPFRLVTGLKCPGCGITTCLLALIRLDFHAAFHANPLVFCLLVPGLVYFVYRKRRYVIYNTDAFSVPETVLLTVLLLIAIAFGIGRNIPRETLANMFHTV